jgi:DNA invertase Pin-like site-specific DNA recombinase
MKRRVKTDAQVVGYVRVSTEDQADSGLGLAAQREAIEKECERRGWTLAAVFEDAGISGKSLEGRQGLEAALSAVEKGDAAGLVVAKLDRLSRSLGDFAHLMEQAHRRGWNLVALDLGIDLSTPAGEFLANVMASAARWERRIIGQRTKDALAVKRRQGVQLGRPRTLDDAVRERIVAAHREGAGLSAIARMLNEERIPTASGGRQWYPSTVQAIIRAEQQTSGVS